MGRTNGFPVAIACTVAALTWAAAAPVPAFAQEWIEFTNRADRFHVNFPGQPVVRETTYQAQRGKPVPARVYTVQDGPRRYSVTVATFEGAGTQPSDVRGSIAWEAWNFRKRGGEITYDAFAQIDRIDGHQLHITNRDQTVTIVAIHLLNSRLYILEATGPPGSPGAVHFQQSLMILDEAGQRIRYEIEVDGSRGVRIMDLTGIC